MSLKATLRSNTLTAPFYGAVREAYVWWRRNWWRPMNAWLRHRSRARGFRTFRWDDLTIRERWNDPYAIHALRGDLRMFATMREAVRRFCPPEPVIFDVGANIGLFSLSCSRIDGAVIYGFEPVSATFALFEENVRENGLGNISCVNLGLSDRPGRMRIGPPSAGADSPSYSVHLPDTPDGSTDPFEEAAFVTIDGFVADNGIERLDYMKIDAEGHDLHVLAGAAEAIRRFRPVIQIEYETRILERPREDAAGLSAFVAQHGCDVYGIFGDAIDRIEDAEAFFGQQHVSRDLIFVPGTR